MIFINRWPPTFGANQPTWAAGPPMGSQ